METEHTLIDFFNPRGVPYAVLIVAITVIASVSIKRALEAIGERFADKRLVLQQIGSFVRFAAYLIGFLGVAFTVLRVQTEVLIALGGTLAVAGGFALKDLAASIVAGVMILVDRPFQVGDRVTFDGYYGEIREIGLRSVRLVTLDDTLVTIPNNKFLTDVVASGNAGAVEMMIQVDFHIGLDQDIGRAKTVVREALTSSRYVHLKRPWAVLVNQVALANYLAIRVRAKAYVLDVRFEKSFESDLTERVIEGFRDAGIAPAAILHRHMDPPARPDPA